MNTLLCTLGLDPENTLGEKLQLEVLLTTRMKVS